MKVHPRKFNLKHSLKEIEDKVDEFTSGYLSLPKKNITQSLKIR